MAALVPYPAATATVARGAARDAIRAALRTDATAMPDAEVDRLAGLASARIEKFASSAPGDVKDEALIRMVAYTRDRPRPYRSLEAGSVKLEFATGGVQRPFVSSGARALLSPWVTRRALPAEEST